MFELKLDHKLDKNVLKANLFTVQNNKYLRDIDVIVDSGCTNTLIPIKYAERKINGVTLGIKLKETMDCTVLGETTTTQAYSIPKIVINNFVINRVMVFAADFKHPLLQDSILLGLNVMNNWLYTTDRIENKLIVEERPHPSIIYKKDIYYNWISVKGNYIKIQDISSIPKADFSE